MLTFSGVFSADQACLPFLSLSYWGQDQDRLHKDNWQNALYPKKNIQIISPLDLTLWQQWFFLKIYIYKCCNMEHRLIPFNLSGCSGQVRHDSAKFASVMDTSKTVGIANTQLFFLRVSRRSGFRVMGAEKKNPPPKVSFSFPGDTIP